MGKFYNIDPETCSMEELKEAVEACKLKEEYYHTMEQSCKVFINSQYGALANKFYNCSNVDIAESITLQGQDLIKYSVIIVNDYFNNRWPNEIETHQRIANHMKEKFSDFDVESFMSLARQPLQFGETLQIYGDSVTGDSIIRLSTGEKTTIEDLFNSECKSETSDKIRIKSDKCVWSYNHDKQLSCIYPIKYIMRHKTCKDIWKFKISNNQIIKVTSDHSIPVLRNNVLVNVNASDLNLNDTVICFTETNFSLKTIIEKENLGNLNDFVYDIEIDSEDASQHYFYANDILVHNTDSVSSNSIIRTEKYPNGIKIEDFYNKNISNIGETTLVGHESVHTDDKVLNYNKTLTYTPVKRIIRHKVTKKKWKITTTSGKSVECTDNHSLIVFRNGEKIKVKPSEIISGDKVLTIEKD